MGIEKIKNKGEITIKCKKYAMKLTKRMNIVL